MSEKEVKVTETEITPEEFSELRDMVKEIFGEVVAPKIRKKEIEEAAELAVKIQNTVTEPAVIDIRDVVRFNELVNKLFPYSEEEG